MSRAMLPPIERRAGAGSASELLVRPLPGTGLVIRSGHLLAVCEPAGCEELLTLVARVAADGGDGVELARLAAELFAAGELSCAVGGTTAEGAAALFVCGHAVAAVDSPYEQIRLAGPEPVLRTVTGPVSALHLTLPGAGEPHPLTRLDAGVVGGAGLTARFAGQPRPAKPSAQSASVEPAEAAGWPAARRPDRSAPFESVLLLPGHAPPPPADEPVGGTQVLVEGVDCKNGHFNDPALRYCQRCGIAMLQVTHVTRLGPRPPLGVLLLDNGMTLRVDADYVVGREPGQDPDVLSGRARPLRIEDSHGGISRRHLRMRPAGWTVQVIDLHSANGTFVQAPGEPEARRLPAGSTALVVPGTKIVFGRRWLRYESHRNP